MSSSDPTIEVTLKCIDNQDDFPERKLILGPTTRIPVGRCSKSAHKQLFAAADNLYIDSPVISRDHAVLTASTSTGIPSVYIMDKGSMHGTTVNSVLLPSDREHKLNNGDTVQFGADVMRDTDSYLAKKYRFESRILPVKAKTPYPSSFPTSFTVPDTTSSDEEDIEDLEDVEEEPMSMPSPARPGYGSQTNPVNVDDYEDVPPEFLDFDENEDDSEVEQEAGDVTVQEAIEIVEEVVEIKAHKDAVEEEQEERSLPLTSHDMIDLNPVSKTNESNPTSQQTSFEENVSDVEDGLPAELLASSSADEDSDESEDEHMSEDNSDRASDDGSEQSVDSLKEDLDTIRRLKMEEMLNHAQESDVDRCSSTLRGSSSQGPSTIGYPPRRPSPPALYGFKPFKPTEAEKGMFDIFQDGPFSDHGMQSPPVPPRPAAPCAPSSMIWNAPPTPLPGPGSDFGPLHHHNPWFEDSPSLHMHNPYTLPNPPEGFHSFSRTDSFSSPNFLPQSRPYMPQLATSYSECKNQGLSKPDEPPVNQLQSPEALKTTGFPTPPTNLQEEQITTPLPTRRTKVSIPEIVENNSDKQQEQPPTPTSMKGQKRKAEVLEESEVADVTPTADLGANESEVGAAMSLVAPVPVAVPKVASLAAERPKKRLRATLVNAGILATGIAIGAVGAFAGLLAVPDSFLQ